MDDVHHAKVYQVIKNGKRIQEFLICILLIVQLSFMQVVAGRTRNCQNIVVLKSSELCATLTKNIKLPVH